MPRVALEFRALGEFVADGRCAMSEEDDEAEVPQRKSERWKTRLPVFDRDRNYCLQVVQSGLQRCTDPETFLLSIPAASASDFDCPSTTKSWSILNWLKESLLNETKAYVALNETGEWLRPEAIAKLAECHQESNTQRVPKPYHKTDTTGDSGQSESVTPPKERGQTEHVGDTRRCFACGKQGHLARNFPEINPKLTVRVKRPLDCEHAEQTFEVHGKLIPLAEQHEVLDGERFGQLRSGDKPLNARIDSGADITVVRRSMATILDENQKGKIRLKGAFGHQVEADLVYVPFRLGSRAVDTGADTLLLCAVTEQLAGEVDALLTPEDLVALREVEQKMPLVDQVDLPCEAAVLKEGPVIEACVVSTQSEGENETVESDDARSD
ncbi:hypothetical protein HPB47_025538 [Ixodes persulcatus]|uniref:Uncharacterized protein n=1 Tax=Ixodes persulcatus TaxID=34615 RepID=A0AC60Q199_IXOPE|nr:hypothetical protein HPB47_025538 [Ixodes persulcatus]